MHEFGAAEMGGGVVCVNAEASAVHMPFLPPHLDACHLMLRYLVKSTGGALQPLPRLKPFKYKSLLLSPQWSSELV